MSKNKIDLRPGLDMDVLLRTMEEKYQDVPHSTIDGLKIDFEQEWVHLRKSNTEPIIRVYAEAGSAARAQAVAQKIMEEVLAAAGK